MSSLAVACGEPEASAPEAAPSAEDDLTSGRVVAPSEYPATVQMVFKNGQCTGAAISEFAVLTAAHCLDRPDGSIDSTAAPGARVLVRGVASAPGVDLEVARVDVHPARIRECQRKGCPRSSEEMHTRRQPDIGVIVFTSRVPAEPAALSFDTVSVGERVEVAGFGCTEDRFGRATWDNTLRVGYTNLLAPSALLHLGSDVKTQGDADQHGQSYLFSRGVRLMGSGVSLCPGDSGGPLYQRIGGKLVVVGVHSSYTFSPIDARAYVNWHTRIDGAAAFEIQPWLERQLR
jgi:V8-like Glu-specific endopeptidase